MKKTLERISFMLIGALLASAGYLLGGADSGADAEPNPSPNAVFNTIQCRKLIVGAPESEQNVVISTETDAVGTIAYMSLSSDNGAIYIEAQPHAMILSLGQTESEIHNHIDISTSDGVARLEMATLKGAMADRPPDVQIRSDTTVSKISVDGRSVMTVNPPLTREE